MQKRVNSQKNITLIFLMLKQRIRDPILSYHNFLSAEMNEEFVFESIDFVKLFNLKLE